MRKISLSYRKLRKIVSRRKDYTKQIIDVKQIETLRYLITVQKKNTQREIPTVPHVTTTILIVIYLSF